MTNLSQLAKEAAEFAKDLADRIGARPAGSLNETQLRNELAEMLSSSGYSAQYQDVLFPKSHLAISPYFVCLLLMVSGWLYPFWPGFFVLFPIFNLFLPTISRLEVKLRKGDSHSQNLFCELEQADKSLPMIIFCAHMDTARVIPIRQQQLLKAYSHFMGVFQRLAILIAILSLMTMFSFQIPVYLNWIIRILTTLVGAFYFGLEIYVQFFHKNQYSPGAVDNGSGVAINVALAKYFSIHPQKRLRLGFLFSTAEETGMQGAVSFAKDNQLNGSKMGVINLDMVGAGQKVCIVDKAGIILPLRTHVVFNQILNDISPEATCIQYTLRGGDFEAFIRHNIPATSVELRGSQKAEMAYHTLNDRSDLIETPSIEIVLTLMIDFITRLPYSNW